MTGLEKYLHSGKYIFNVVLMILSLTGAICVVYVLDDYWNGVSLWQYVVALIGTLVIYIYVTLSIVLDMLYIKSGGKASIAIFVSKTARKITEEDIQNEKRR